MESNVVPITADEHTYKNDIGLRMIYINYIKRQFSIELSDNLDLTWVPAPLYVTKRSGLNDDLNGQSTKLSFIKDAQMPAFPTDATDVLSMTEEELEALAEELQYGLLGMLMMGFGI